MYNNEISVCFQNDTSLASQEKVFEYFGNENTENIVNVINSNIQVVDDVLPFPMPKKNNKKSRLHRIGLK